MAVFEVADPALGTDLSAGSGEIDSGEIESNEIDSGEEILERVAHLVDCEGPGPRAARSSGRSERESRMTAPAPP